MDLQKEITKLVQYGLDHELIQPEDKIYTINQYLEIFHLDEYEEPDISGEEIVLEDILKNLLDAAYDRYIIKSNDVVTRDLFDTRLMGVLAAKPSQIIKEFWEYYEESPEAATNFFYKFSQDTDYIRRYRIKKDMRWKVDSPYGEIDITINLSKPEKDPKAIAAAKNAKQSAYPKCQLCMENEGYAGRMNHPARQNHRIIPLTINGSKWGFQYSPYVYYNEHCIVFNGEHVPMKIDRNAFRKLFDFVKQFPHYFLGSNADLPIVGGSILTHDHFQGGHYEFAMERAQIEKEIQIPGYEDVEAGIVHWPLSVIRIRCKDENRLIDLADYILTKWRGYTDEEAYIFAETDGEPHNTITPIARKKGDVYELDLTLRNNITTEECPLGLYHPHSEYHHIKKENIGLIEVMGLAVLPSRLKKEMELLAECLVENKPMENYEELQKHIDWVHDFMPKYNKIKQDNVMDILKEHEEEDLEKTIEELATAKPVKTKPSKTGVVVKGIDNCLVKLSKCCNPLPGDEIVGYITKGRGVSVHRTDCPNLKDLLNEENRMIDVYWYDDVKGSYSVDVEIFANDRNGLLKDVIKQVDNVKAKLMGVNARTSRENITNINITVEIENIDELKKLLTALRNIESVYEVKRKRG